MIVLNLVVKRALHMVSLNSLVAQESGSHIVHVDLLLMMLISDVIVQVACIYRVEVLLLFWLVLVRMLLLLLLLLVRHLLIMCNICGARLVDLKRRVVLELLMELVVLLCQQLLV